MAESKGASGDRAWLSALRESWHEFRKDCWVSLTRLFLASLVMASIFKWLDHCELLGFLDQLVFECVQSLDDNSPSAARDIEELKLPVLLEIDDTAWDQLFDQARPLDRGRLAQILSALDRLENRPTVLAIDLDLSPVRNGTNSPSQVRLEQALKQIAEDLHVVAIKPLGTSLADTAMANEDWEQRIAATTKVHFASACVGLTGSSALDFDESLATLGLVAWSLTAPAPAPALRPPADEQCFDVKQRGRAIHTGLYRAATADVTRRDDSQRHITVVPRPDGDGIALFPAAKTQSRVVFLGGAFGGDDLFLTPLGKQYGMVVQAATFATKARNHNREIPHAIAFLFDTLLGMVTGLIFDMIWSAYGSERLSFRRSFRKFELGIAPPARPQEIWPHYNASLFYLGAGLVALGLALYFVVLFAVFLVDHDWWLNPAGIIVGMFVDAEIASRNKPDAGDADRDAAAWRPYVCFQVDHFRMLFASGGNATRRHGRLFAAERWFYLAIVVIALYLVFFE
jgi:hypothetical protein